MLLFLTEWLTGLDSASSVFRYLTLRSILGVLFESWVDFPIEIVQQSDNSPQLDILTEPHFVVEPSEHGHHLGAGDERGRGHI